MSSHYLTFFVLQNGLIFFFLLCYKSCDSALIDGQHCSSITYIIKNIVRGGDFSCAGGVRETNKQKKQQQQQTTTTPRKIKDINIKYYPNASIILEVGFVSALEQIFQAFLFLSDCG